MMHAWNACTCEAEQEGQESMANLNYIAFSKPPGLHSKTLSEREKKIKSNSISTAEEEI